MKVKILIAVVLVLCGLLLGAFVAVALSASTTGALPVVLARDLFPYS